jgi:hypothetical protein
MLQLFYLSVVKVDLDVEWSSEEEKASVGAMAASAVSWRQRSTGGHVDVCGSGVGPHSAAPDQQPTLRHRRCVGDGTGHNRCVEWELRPEPNVPALSLPFFINRLK